MGKRFDSGARTGVVIVGAGPAGLVLGNLLLDQGIDCVILERRGREAVEGRARAGFLAAHSVRVLTQHGLADGMLARGHTHRTCLFRSERGEFTLDYGELGRGEVHTVYPQQELVRDLLAEYLRRGGAIRFDTEVEEISGAGSAPPTARTSSGATSPGATDTAESPARP